jgi:rfaE bifunctional protein nucleotidyltransferase chain/domain
MKKVFTNGCFDVLHRGHIELFRFCKSLGYVIVGLNSDNSVRRLKGDKRPFFCQDDRKFMLESIKFIDEVIIFDEDTPLLTIEKIKPDLLVKGGDYRIDQVAGSRLCETIIFDFVPGYSSSKILGDKIISS